MSNRFAQAEKLLYTYPVNILRLNTAILELRELRADTDCHAQTYSDTHSSGGRHSDPVAGYSERVSMLEGRIARLIRRTDPVSVVRSLVKNSEDERDRELFCVMELYYFEHMTIDEIAMHLRRSVSTIYRRRDDLVGLVIYELTHWKSQFVCAQKST